MKDGRYVNKNHFSKVKVRKYAPLPPVSPVPNTTEKEIKRKSTMKSRNVIGIFQSIFKKITNFIWNLIIMKVIL